MPKAVPLFTAVLWVACLLYSPASTAAAEIPPQLQVTPAQLPATDLSDPIGSRLLHLLDEQAIRSLNWMADERKLAGITDEGFVINWNGSNAITGEYNLYQAMSAAYAFAILARCGQPGETMGGTTRQVLESGGVALIKAVIETHPVVDGPRAHPRWWPKGWALRIDHVAGMAAWLLWDKLDSPTQMRIAQILEHDADLHINDPAPARLIDDTQAESNAWNAGGIVLAACMLEHHPHRALWDDKAKELMLSAYATPEDVASSRVVDGKPLNQWLKAPNVFSDYTLENHGYVFPDYMAAISEMVRGAICYRLAGRPIPQAVTFNADRILEQLAAMSMPAGHYFYVQGTDYFSRRLDSFFQAGNALPLRPDPLLNGVFLRSLTSLEKMAADRPNLPMNGWEGMRLEFGTLWGLTENYLMRRLLGSGGPALPDDQINGRLAGVRVYNDGKFALHRTATTISSFSWHTSAKASQVMGLVMPLDLDALCYPMPGGIIGEITEKAPASAPAQTPPTTIRTVRIDAAEEGFGVLAELERCGGKVLQECAFVSLPDGSVVYLEKRTALGRITIDSATCGNVVFCDDTRWVYQPKARTFHGSTGALTPDASRRVSTNWINVDERMGFIVVGRPSLRLFKLPGTPCVFRRNDTMYDTCRMEFVEEAGVYNPGQQISLFGLLILPNQAAGETKLLASAVAGTGWLTDTDGVLALSTGSYVVYANLTQQAQSVAAGKHSLQCPGRTAGWFPIAASSGADMMLESGASGSTTKTHLRR